MIPKTRSKNQALKAIFLTSRKNIRPCNFLKRALNFVLIAIFSSFIEKTPTLALNIFPTPLENPRQNYRPLGKLFSQANLFCPQILGLAIHFRPTFRDLWPLDLTLRSDR
jgi:hypothetical protein